MKEPYRISIIVPVYNAKEYLKQCVDSLVGQDYENKSIWLVDDGSTDGSGAFCDELAAQYESVQVVHKPNGGLISAWKCGTSACDGEYVTFVDSDDWLDTDMLNGMGKYLTGGEAEIVASDYVIERDNGTKSYVYQMQQPGVYERPQIEAEIIPNLLGREQRIIAFSRCMKLISKKLILDHMGFCDERIKMAEDTTIMLPALMNCHRLVVLDKKAYYHYRYVQESMVHKYDKGMFENFLLWRKVVLQIVERQFRENKTLLDEMLYKADQEMLHMLLLVLKNEARGNPKGYRENIRCVCAHEEMAPLIKNTKIHLDNKANKLLYMCLQKPNFMNLSLLRLAMILYYR